MLPRSKDQWPFMFAYYGKIHLKNDLIKNNESVGRREGEVMSILTFKGGVHPFEGKDMSKNKPIMDLEPVGELVFPVSQHIGAPAVPVVEVGDKVLAGTLIAKATGFISANIHSSVSGVVKAIEPRMVAAGNKVLSIIVENESVSNTALLNINSQGVSSAFFS